MLKWPDRNRVDSALRTITAEVAAAYPELLRLGYIGSYARGDWGVGSDLDILAIVSESARPFAERAAAFDFPRLPVPADVLVYTRSEWEALQREGGRFAREADRDAVWVYSRHSED